MSDDIASDRAWVPPTCTLPTAEQPLRVAEFDALFTEAVRAVRRERPTRLRLELAFSPAHAARAAELAVRENGCCSFFAFAVTVADGGLALEVTVPARHAEVLDALQARADAAVAAEPLHLVRGEDDPAVRGVRLDLPRRAERLLEGRRSMSSAPADERS